jgi:hypothetical protein
MDADGRDIRQTTHSVGAADMAAWSPDGEFISYAEQRIDWELFALPHAGGVVHRLTGAQGQDTSPSWQSTPTVNGSNNLRALTASPSSGVAGTAVTLRGSGCGKPGDVVTIRFEGAPSRIWGESLLGTVTLDGEGEFEVSHTIPAAIKWWSRPLSALLAGEYVFFVDPSGCEAPFTVEADAEWQDPSQVQPPDTNFPPSPGGVPVGGGSPGGRTDSTLVTLGAGMIAFALVICAAALRRRPQP